MSVNLDSTKKDIVDEIRDCQKALGRPVITDWKTRGMDKQDLLDILAELEVALIEADTHEYEVVEPVDVESWLVEQVVLEAAADAEMEERLQAVLDAAWVEIETEAAPMIETLETTSEVVTEAPVRKPKGDAPEGQRWCSWHKCFHAMETDGKPTFSVNNKSKDGLDGRCKVGWSEYKKAHKPVKES